MLTQCSLCVAPGRFVLIHIVHNKGTNPGAAELNRATAIFLKDLLSVMDRSLVLDLVWQCLLFLLLLRLLTDCFAYVVDPLSCDTHRSSQWPLVNRHSEIRGAAHHHRL
jgi:hypothetical protein